MLLEHELEKALLGYARAKGQLVDTRRQLTVLDSSIKRLERDIRKCDRRGLPRKYRTIIDDCKRRLDELRRARTVITREIAELKNEIRQTEELSRG